MVYTQDNNYNSKQLECLQVQSSSSYRHTECDTKSPPMQSDSPCLNRVKKKRVEINKCTFDGYFSIKLMRD